MANAQLKVEVDVVDRLSDVLTETIDAVHRFEAAVARLEEIQAKADHAQIVGRLIDERFRTVTR